MTADRGPAPRGAHGIDIPVGLRRNVEHHPAGQGWLDDLPARLDRLVDRWGLTVGPPFTTGVAAWTAPARTRSGADVVVKLSLPHDEARGEAAALRTWGGRGAVRLLAHAPREWALLLDRCRPGTGLDRDTGADVDRLRTAARVLRTLHTGVPADASAEPSSGIRVLANVGTRGAEVLLATADAVAAHPDRPLAVDPDLVPAAAGLLRDLPTSARRHVLVHGDLNPGNILAAGADPVRSGDRGVDPSAEGGARSDPPPPTWLAIDPKPLVGDPAYDPWPLLAQVGAPFAAADPVATLRGRVALVADDAGLDADRVVAWSFARSVQSAFWYAAEGRWRPAADELGRAAVWRRLLP